MVDDMGAQTARIDLMEWDILHEGYPNRRMTIRGNPNCTH